MSNVQVKFYSCCLYCAVCSVQHAVLFGEILKYLSLCPSPLEVICSVCSVTTPNLVAGLKLRLSSGIVRLSATSGFITARVATLQQWLWSARATPAALLGGMNFHPRGSARLAGRWLVFRCHWLWHCSATEAWSGLGCHRASGGQ